MDIILYLAIPMAFGAGFIVSTLLEARRQERRDANLRAWTEKS